MDEAAWRKLLATLTVEGELAPVGDEQLDAYERAAGVRLSASYRAFCKAFGPGELAGWYEFAVPGDTSEYPRQFDLATKNIYTRTGLEWDEYAQDVEQFRRAIIFGSDQASGMFLWDPAEATRPGESGCAVYAIWRDWTTERVCDTFWQFVLICLHRGAKTLYTDSPPLTFRGSHPASE